MPFFGGVLVSFQFLRFAHREKRIVSAKRTRSQYPLQPNPSVPVVDMPFLVRDHRFLLTRRQIGEQVACLDRPPGGRTRYEVFHWSTRTL